MCTGWGRFGGCPMFRWVPESPSNKPSFLLSSIVTETCPAQHFRQCLKRYQYWKHKIYCTGTRKSPNSTRRSRHFSTRLDTFDVSSESIRACRAVLIQRGGRRTSRQIVLNRCTLSLPAWFLRQGAPVFSKRLAELFNLSFSRHLRPQCRRSVRRQESTQFPKLPDRRTAERISPDFCHCSCRTWLIEVYVGSWLPISSIGPYIVYV